MKNKMTRNVILMAVVTVIMAVALSLYIQNTGTVPAADNAASLTDGIYTSSAQGCLSDVTVKVTVTGGRPVWRSTLPARLPNWAAPLPKLWQLHCSRPVLPLAWMLFPVPL